MWMPSAVRLFLLRYNIYPESRYEAALNREFDEWKKRGNKPPSPSLLKQKIVQEYGLKSKAEVLVETGTYMGAMVKACKSSFSSIYSIELQTDFYERARRRFSSESHVKLLHGNSAHVLPSVLRELDRPTLFWLDAHYSGDLTAKADRETPIMQELLLILNHTIKGHVILIDDARLFNGTHDYPTHEAVSDLAASRGYSIFEADDVLRLTPSA
jgi:hypothetical protein